MNWNNRKNWNNKKKNLLKGIAAELGNVMGSPWFYLAVAGLVVLLLSAEYYTDGFGRSYSIGSLFFAGQKPDRQFAFSYLLSAGVGGGMFRCFASLCISLPFVMRMSSERTCGYIRFANYYAGTGKYVLVKGLTGLLSGGLVAAAGFLCYTLVLLSGAYICGWDSLPDGAETAVVCLRLTLGVFLYGVFSIGWIYPFVGWIKDKYVLVCIPFLCRYLYLQVLFQISLKKAEMVDITGLERVSKMYPDSIIFSTGQNTDWQGLCLRCLLVLAAVALWLIVMKRRRDLGE